jgi:hypothetical protein
VRYTLRPSLGHRYAFASNDNVILPDWVNASHQPISPSLYDEQRVAGENRCISRLHCHHCLEFIVRRNCHNLHTTYLSLLFQHEMNLPAASGMVNCGG